MGAVTVVVAYLLMGAALRHLPSSTAMTLGLAEPLTAATLGVAVLGETLTLLQLVGVLLVLGGIVIAGTGKAVTRVPVVA
jgi:DME family drug/metabolite transporter